MSVSLGKRGLELYCEGCLVDLIMVRGQEPCGGGHLGEISVLEVNLFALAWNETWSAALDDALQPLERA
ncbi:uncharacterized [Tachysurus ichikawai]